MSSLAREASIDRTSNSKESRRRKNLLSSFEDSVETGHMFSQSQRIQASREESTRSMSESFEARAICTEFEAAVRHSYVVVLCFICCTSQEIIPLLVCPHIQPYAKSSV